MRCTKCGFVSFDYLSECRKCGTNLVVARDQFGFSPAKPALAAYLGSLLSGSEPLPAPQEKPPAETAVSPSFDFGEELGGGFRQVEEFGMNPSGPAPNPDEGEEDYSLLDLSDEELELLIDKEPEKPEKKAPDLWLEFDADAKKPAPPAAEPPAPPAAPAPPEQPSGLSLEAAEDFTPSIDFDSLPGIDTKAPAPEPAAKAAPESTAAPQIDTPDEPDGMILSDPALVPLRKEIEFEEETLPEKNSDDILELGMDDLEEAQPAKTNATDDFVIDLSEKDLEGLLMELESSREKPEDKKPSEPKPGNR